MGLSRETLISKLKALSPEQQAAVLRRLEGSPATAGPSQIERVGPGQPVPVSFAQRALWLADRIGGASAKYNMVSSYRLQGDVDVSALSRAFEIIVDRHESLRTTFSESKGEAIQVVHESGDFGFEVLQHDLSGFPDADAELRRVLENNAHWVFDLTKGPLLRIELAKVAADVVVLMMNVHHIIYDGASKGVLLRELNVLYGRLAGADAAVSLLERNGQLAEVPVQYRDFSAWQAEHVPLAPQLDYWQRTLAGAPQLITLPTDYPRPAVRQDTGAIERVLLPKALAEPFLAIGRGSRASSFMTLLAAFATVLSRYAGRGDVVIGTPVDNRSRQELQRVIGYFLNTLALRCEVDENESFLELLQRVKAVCEGAYAHQDAPWDEVVQLNHPVRSTAYEPGFQVMMVLQNPTSHDFTLPGLDVSKVGAGTNTTKYDIYFTLVEAESGLEGWITYNTTLFKRDTILRLVENLRALMEAVSGAPEQPLHRLPAIAPQERDMLACWNETDVASQHRSLVHVFREIVSQDPERTALKTGQRDWSYGELDRKAQAIAQRLHQVGVRSGDAVAIELPRSGDLVAACLGAWMCGACYVPVDPQAPAARNEHILQDAAPKVVVTATARSKAHEAQCVVLTIDEVGDAPVGEPWRPVVSSAASTPAYVLYTSGSTGVPKGVMGTQGGLLNRLEWMWRTTPYQDNEVLAFKTTISFVDAVAELWGPLLAGRPVAVYEQQGYFDLYDFIQFLQREAVTRIVVVPSLLRSLLEFYPDWCEQLPCLRHVVVSGEELPASLVRAFHDTAKNVELLNVYGSTEVAADATCHLVTAQDADALRVPIGSAMDNTRSYILDPWLNPVPIGARGELYIAGAGLAVGYHGAPAYTADRFLPDPFGGVGERMFRTGDVARYRSDGEIEFCGRCDGQVKVRGMRFDLREIEAELLAVNGVAQAICVSRQHSGADSQLQAYVQVEEGADVLQGDIFAHLTGRLPPHMVPSSVTMLDELPLLVNGKVDRLALPEPTPGDQRDAASAQQIVAPTTDTQITLVEIWQQTLEQSEIHANSNFFALGGHSLAATKIVAEIRQRFGIETGARDVFEAPTLAALAERVDQALNVASLTSEALSDDVGETEVFEF